MPAEASIRLVVLDWAGTTIDHGSRAPVSAFVGAFAGQKVAVTDDQARAPMGLQKRDHIVTMLRMPEVAAEWRRVHGRDWTEADADTLYHAFVPLQLEVLDRHGDLVPGVQAAAAALRRRGIKIGATTGYFQEAAARVYAAAAGQGYDPDFKMCAADVQQGRPAPWMIYRIMEAAGVYPPSAVLKVGDTVPDIEEGRNAGSWSVGVLRACSEVGLSAAQFDALPAAEKRARLDAAGKTLKAAGAHAVIDSLEELPALIETLEARLRKGERP